MRKLIILLVAVVFIAGGFGNLAYAQTEQNEIMVGFHESHVYIAEGDSFTNLEVVGQKYWGTEIFNIPDGSGKDISELELSLDYELPVPPEPPLH